MAVRAATAAARARDVALAWQPDRPVHPVLPRRLPHPALLLPARGVASPPSPSSEAGDHRGSVGCAPPRRDDLERAHRFRGEGEGLHRHRHRPEGLLRPQRRGQQVSGRLSAGAQAWPWVRGSQHATIPVDQRTAGRVCRTPGRGDRARFSAAGSRPRPLHRVLHGRHADRCPVACVTATDNHRSETLSDSAGPFAVHLAVRRGR